MDKRDLQKLSENQNQTLSFFNNFSANLTGLPDDWKT
jgi:hypothetical protein